MNGYSFIFYPWLCQFSFDDLSYGLTCRSCPEAGESSLIRRARFLLPTMPSAEFCHTVTVDYSPLSLALSRKRLAKTYGRSPGVRHIAVNA